MEINPNEQPGLFLLIGGNWQNYPTQKIYAEKTGFVGDLVQLSPTAMGRKVYPAVRPFSQDEIKSERIWNEFLFGAENVASDIEYQGWKAGIGTVIGGVKLAEGLYESFYPTRKITGLGLDIGHLDIIDTGKARQGISPQFYEAGKALIEPEIFIATIVIPSSIAAKAATGSGIAAKGAQLFLPVLVGAGTGLEILRSAEGKPIREEDIARGIGYGAGIFLTWKGMELGAKKGFEFFEGRTDKGLMEITGNIFKNQRYVNIKDYYAEVGGDEIKMNKAVASTEKAMKNMPESEVDRLMGLKTEKIRPLEEMPSNKKPFLGLDFSKPISIEYETFSPRQGYSVKLTIFDRFQAYAMEAPELKITEKIPEINLRMLEKTPEAETMGVTTERATQTPEIPKQRQSSELSTLIIRKPQILENLITPMPAMPNFAQKNEELSELDYMEDVRSKPKLAKSERLRIERMQKYTLATAQNLRLASAQNLRLATAQNLRIGAIILTPAANSIKKRKFQLGLKGKGIPFKIQYRTAYASLGNIFESEVRYGKATQPLFTLRPKELGFFNVPTLEQIKAKGLKNSGKR